MLEVSLAFGFSEAVSLAQPTNVTEHVQSKFCLPSVQPGFHFPDVRPHKQLVSLNYYYNCSHSYYDYHLSAQRIPPGRIKCSVVGCNR